MTLALSLSVAATVALADGAAGVDEVKRIRAHLDGAIEQLLAADTSSLDDEQRRRRALHVERLRAYRDRGLFPRNLDYAGARVPYFRDAFGTLCAMAMLIDESGRPDLVQKVALMRNNALVEELADDTELAAWLVEQGITLDEAARIQPSYTTECFADCGCVRVLDADDQLQTVQARAVVVAVIADDDDDGTRLQLRKIATYGDCGAGAVVPEVRDADVLDELTFATVGERFLIPVIDDVDGPRELASFDWYSIARSGRVQCPTCNGALASCAEQPLPPDIVVRALLAPDCAAALDALAPQNEECPANDAPPPPELTACEGSDAFALATCGCNAADARGAPGGAVAAIVAMLVLFARRRR